MKNGKRTIRRMELAREILLLARRANWREGHHLTEQGLANSLRVSRSPVRAALGVLECSGAVINRPNHGYFLNGSPEILLVAIADPPPNVEEKLYIAIIDARLAGEISENVNQIELMNHFDAPRNLVELVLARLAEESLMERRPGRGWRFMPTFDSSRSWQNGYQLRLIVEPAGILLPQFEIDHERMSRSRITHMDLLESAQGMAEPASWVYRLDVDFHEMVASFSNNAFFLQAIQTQNRLWRLLEYRGYRNHRRTADWCQEHLAIIDALERGRLEVAAGLMRQHLDLASKMADAVGAPRAAVRQGEADIKSGAS